MTAPWLQGAMIGVPLGGQVLFFSQTGMPRGPVTVRFDRTIGPDLVRTGTSTAISRGRHNVVASDIMSSDDKMSWRRQNVVVAT